MMVNVMVFMQNKRNTSMLGIIIKASPTDKVEKSIPSVLICYQYHCYGALGSIFQVYGPPQVHRVFHKQGGNRTLENPSKKEATIFFYTTL